MRYLRLIQGKIEPATYTLSLDAIDGEPDPESFSSLPVTSITKDEHRIALKTSLPRRRLWWGTTFPNNCTESDQAISGSKKLSEYVDYSQVASSTTGGDAKVHSSFARTACS